MNATGVVSRNRLLVACESTVPYLMDMQSNAYTLYMYIWCVFVIQYNVSIVLLCYAKERTFGSEKEMIWQPKFPFWNKL